MSYKFSRCESSNQLRKIPVNTAYVEKEIIEAKRDLDSARKLLGSSEIKWAIISSYYSMFHACKSLLYYAGYEEKSHECVIIAIDELYVEKSLLPFDIIKNIQDAKTARETADYGLTYGEDSAKKVVADAEQVYTLITHYLIDRGLKI